MKIGDRIQGNEKEWLSITDLFEDKEVEPVYNLRIADYHTYFVGEDFWSWCIWAHNHYFEVGAFNELKQITGWARHHVPQTVVALAHGATDFVRANGPAIRIPEWMHKEIIHLESVPKAPISDEFLEDL
ncbi:hypothetical protein KIH39_15565 [Telmatocola sphagniphila]|uniref:Intein C-terminal splicing domain-containing protein n=1 Tax=Telmatocola sphagniphila TaxID=1123043 RepID=A0A8E6F0L3_9BACT|nr:hypothetical protein KIH39_15565 [Telmatocola sphagniphila]